MDEKRINEKLAGASPDEILAWALKTFPYRIGMTTSFQNSGVVLIDMIRRIAFGFPDLLHRYGIPFPGNPGIQGAFDPGMEPERPHHHPADEPGEAREGARTAPVRAGPGPVLPDQ